MGSITSFIPRLSAGVATMRARIGQRLQNRSAHDLPRPVRLYRPDAMGIAYLWLDAADGMITIKVGNLGHPAESAHYDAAHWPRIRDHLEHLRDMGFAEIPASEMAYLQITCPVTGERSDANDLARRDALLDHVAGFLAETGQGGWADSTTGEERMEIGFHVVDFDIAHATLTDLLDAGTLGDDLSILRHGEPAFDNDPGDVEPPFDNHAADPEAELHDSAAQPARVRPRRVTQDRFGDLAPAS
ncbi:hypothetical protein [Aquicoccus porphyridii]|uniref:hypothetical protein n=1 Tax=Aquicoccus porphyridii TaxID=1852029 RepID=UPI00273F8502|nr:hypothetical protein [Aquicoccus porphyridii]